MIAVGAAKSVLTATSFSHNSLAQIPQNGEAPIPTAVVVPFFIFSLNQFTISINQTDPNLLNILPFPKQNPQNTGVSL